MSGGQIEGVEIPCPPLPIQRRIADILSAYDDLIENNNRRIAILEEMAQNLYREWFVHFRFPGHEHVKMVDSPLGPIPEGWEVTRLGDIVTTSREDVDLPTESETRTRTTSVYDIQQRVTGYHNEANVHGLQECSPGAVDQARLRTFSSAGDFWPLQHTLWCRTRISGGLRQFIAYYLA